MARFVPITYPQCMRLDEATPQSKGLCPRKALNVWLPFLILTDLLFSPDRLNR